DSRTEMKTTLIFLSALTLMSLHAMEVNTNLSQSIKVERPLEEVVRAMQIYYYETNYHGYAQAVSRTNAVRGVSYTMTIADCAFDVRVGGVLGEMVATSVATNSTKLEFLVWSGFSKESEAGIAVKQGVAKTLERIARIAETKR